MIITSISNLGHFSLFVLNASCGGDLNLSFFIYMFTSHVSVTRNKEVNDSANQYQFLVIHTAQYRCRR